MIKYGSFYFNICVLLLIFLVLLLLFFPPFITMPDFMIDLTPVPPPERMQPIIYAEWGRVLWREPSSVLFVINAVLASQIRLIYCLSPTRGAVNAISVTLNSIPQP